MAKRAEQGQLMVADSEKKRPRQTTTRRANDLDGGTWTRYSISVWDDIRKTPEEVALKHPAMFPSQLASRLIQCFTTGEQRVVLDPFAGIGSTILAAESLGKVGIGLDVSPEYVAKAQNRPNLPVDMFRTNGNATNAGERRLHVADATKLLEFVDRETVDLVVTSPPYWDILLQERTADYKDVRHYGDAAQDLGKIRDYQEFLAALARVFSEVFAALKFGAYCCVVVMDIRKKDRFYPFHSDLAERMKEIGFTYDDLIIWDRGQEYNNLRPLGHPAVFRINKVHEYILIFRKLR